MQTFCGGERKLKNSVRFNMQNTFENDCLFCENKAKTDAVFSEMIQAFFFILSVGGGGLKSPILSIFYVFSLSCTTM